MDLLQFVVILHELPHATQAFAVSTGATIFSKHPTHDPQGETCFTAETAKIREHDKTAID
jgi:hypothetical protein